MSEAIILDIDGKKLGRALLPPMLYQLITTDEEFKQRLKEHEAYNEALDVLQIKYCYSCRECNAELWMSYHDIMLPANEHTMPCGHRWSKLDTKQADWEAWKAHNPLEVTR